LVWGWVAERRPGRGRGRGSRPPRGPAKSDRERDDDRGGLLSGLKLSREVREGLGVFVAALLMVVGGTVGALTFFSPSTQIADTPTPTETGSPTLSPTLSPTVLLATGTPTLTPIPSGTPGLTGT